MRFCPDHILSMLKAYDRDLSMRWCPRLHCWWFTWKGTDQFVYRHRDYSLAMNLDSSSEILDIVKDCDLNHCWLDKLKQMERGRAERLYREAKDSEAYGEECSREAAHVIDYVQRGKKAKPFSHIINNPTLQEA